MKILILKVFLLFICPPVNAEIMYTAEVIASSLNIRSIPSNEGRIIGSLFKGQQILVTPSSNEWVKTQLDGNEIGYISSIHLKMIDTRTNNNFFPIKKNINKDKCSPEQENINLNILDVNMECKDSIIVNGYESCNAKFDVVVESYCNKILDVEINCVAEFKYNTDEGFSPYSVTENNLGTIYTNDGRGSTVIEVKLNLLASSEPVVKVELTDGMCSVVTKNYF